MSTLLLSVLLFAVLLELVAASSPIMDYTMSTGPLDTSYPETDMFESFFCDFCSLPFYQCVHAIMVRAIVLLFATRLTPLGPSAA
jgi:hypothetical protein